MTAMKPMRILVGAVALVASAGCADLDVSNPNNPDVERVLATPEDVQNLAISSVRSWYLTSTFVEPYLMMSVTADALTANFGNFGMRFNNLEPRIAYENSSAGGDRDVAEEPWEGNYSVLGAANDVLRAFDAGVVLPTDSATEKYANLARFTQAASLTNLALIFDRAFIVDHTTDVIANPPELQDYQAVSADALARWEALISDIEGSQWAHSYLSDVIPMEDGLDSDRMARIANTMAALLVAYTPRTAAEAETADWAKVAQLADKGIGTGSAGAPFDMTVIGNGSTWWSYINYYGNEPSWTRVDLRLINRAAPATPAKYTGTVPPKAVSADARVNCGPFLNDAEGNPTTVAICGDFRYHGSVIGDPGRGIYMQSPYSHFRYDFHRRFSSTPAEGPVPYLLAAESDLVRAEALIRSGGSLATAADLINTTRVGRGGLPPASAADGADTLLEYIEYERDIELLNSSGFVLFRKRIRDELQPGTVRQLPIPAKELETLGLPIYTFGGGGA